MWHSGGWVGEDSESQSRCWTQDGRAQRLTAGRERGEQRQRGFKEWRSGARFCKGNVRVEFELHVRTGIWVHICTKPVTQ